MFTGVLFLAGFCGAVHCLALFCCGARDEEQAHYSGCWPVQRDGTILPSCLKKARCCVPVAAPPRSIEVFETENAFGGEQSSVKRREEGKDIGRWGGR